MALLLLLPTLPMFTSTTLSSPSTRIYINPPTITAPLSGNFTVDINIEDVTDLYAWDVKLIWDPLLLDCVNATGGDFLKAGGSTLFGYDPPINESEGWVFVHGSISPLIPPFVGVSGSGTLATIKFHGVNLGECNLNVSNITLIGSPVSVPAPPYLGDTNHDREVNGFDVVNIAKYFRGYDPDADFNNDSIVDYFDLFCVSFNFGRSYDPYNPEETALKPEPIEHEVIDGYITISSPRVHNIDTGLNYMTIQEAIDAPETLNEHNIEVDAGTYIENVKVTKSLTIFGKDGPTATTVIANAAGPVFDVTANYVSIMNFSVTNGTELPTDNYGAGIYLREVTHCNISNNIIYENLGITSVAAGIYIDDSHFNNIVNNTIRDNSMHGIHMFGEEHGHPTAGVFGSHHNSIRNNIIFGNKDGMFVLGSYNNLTDNIIYSNEQGGVSFRDDVHCRIENNTVTSNSREGVALTHCHNFTVRNNEISMSGSWCGLRLGSSSNNTVSGNMLKKNVGAGISIDTYYVHSGVGVPSLNNKIYENTFIMNDQGIKIRSLHEPHTGNVIYHNNFINNTVGQAEDPWSNLWDDGYPSGGNYWSDHNPFDWYSGPDQDEEGSDEIGDTPYVIDENNEDRYPLIYPYNWELNADINKDGFVDIYDVVLMSLAFGSFIGHPHWNALTDIKGHDGVVDIFDVVVVAQHFGQPYPPP